MLSSPLFPLLPPFLDLSAPATGLRDPAHGQGPGSFGSEKLGCAIKTTYFFRLGKQQ